MIADVSHWARFFRRRSLPERAAEAGAELGLSERGNRIYLPLAARGRNTHGLVAGASGTGKTVLLADALARSIAGERRTHAPQDRTAHFLCIPKHDLYRHFVDALALYDKAAIEELRVLRPFDPGFAFNVFRLRRTTPVDLFTFTLAELVGLVSTDVGGRRDLGIGARQHECISLGLLAAAETEHEQKSPLLALDAYTLPGGMKQLAATTRSERARQFLRHTELPDELRVSVASRLRLAFAATELIESMMSAPGAVDFDDLFAPGRITLLDLSDPFGVPAVVAFLANTFVRLAVDHLQARPSPWTGHSVRIVLEEMQMLGPVLTSVGESLLTTGRSRGLSVIGVTQGCSTLPSSLLDVFQSNVAWTLYGRMSPVDAEAIARGVAPRPGVEEPIRVIRERVAASLATVPERCFLLLRSGERERFRSRDFDFVAAERARAENAGVLVAAERALGLPPDQSARLKLHELSPSLPRATRERRRDRTDADRGSALPCRSRWG